MCLGQLWDKSEYSFGITWWLISHYWQGFPLPFGEYVAFLAKQNYLKMNTAPSQGSSDDGNATLRLHFLKPFTKEEVESFKFFSLIHGCLAKAMVPLPPCPGMCQTKCTENIVRRWPRRWSVPSCRSCSSSCTPFSQLRSHKSIQMKSGNWPLEIYSTLGRPKLAL